MSKTLLINRNATGIPIAFQTRCHRCKEFYLIDEMEPIKVKRVGNAGIRYYCTKCVAKLGGKPNTQFEAGDILAVLSSESRPELHAIPEYSYEFSFFDPEEAYRLRFEEEVARLQKENAEALKKWRKRQYFEFGQVVLRQHQEMTLRFYYPRRPAEDYHYALNKNCVWWSVEEERPVLKIRRALEEEREEFLALQKQWRRLSK